MKARAGLLAHLNRKPLGVVSGLRDLPVLALLREGKHSAGQAVLSSVSFPLEWIRCGE
jgi:hypothetical protein